MRNGRGNRTMKFSGKSYLLEGRCCSPWLASLSYFEREKTAREKS